MHVGYPKPPALMPVPPNGLGVISNTMLSGRAESPETPPTPERWSRPRLLRTRHAMLWSAHDVSPLTPTPPTITLPGIKRQPSTEHINSADLVADHRVLRSTD